MVESRLCAVNCKTRFQCPRSFVGDIPDLGRRREGAPLPLFLTRTNKHAGENEQVCKNRAQKLDIKELTSQNLENKGLSTS
jgi:hypothetical protein